MPIFLSPNDDNVSYVTTNTPLEIYAFAGNDTVIAGNDSDFVDGGDGNDLLQDFGGFGNDHLVGGNDNDKLFAVAGNDWLEGGNGDDVLDSGSDADILDGGPGQDAMDGGAGNDTLYSGTGKDIMVGGDDNDVFYADGSFADGADFLRGDGGNDVYVLGGANVAFYPDDPGLDRVEAPFSFSLAGLAVEDLTLTGGAAIDGIGNALANTLNGNDAANALSGEGGNDLIRGYGGNDTLTGGLGGGVEYLYGGTGDDTYNVLDGQDAPVEFAGEGHDTARTTVTFSLAGLPQVEDIVLLGSAALGATGNALANVLTGNGAGNVLDGGTGYDTLAGGGGNDFYMLDDITFVDDFTGPDYDIVVEAPDGGIDTVYVSQQGLDRFFLAPNVENVVVTGTQALTVFGNVLGNYLLGNAAHNYLYGDAGNDTLNGGAGIDRLEGAAGNDVYLLNDVTFVDDVTGLIYDEIAEQPGGGLDTVYVSQQGLQRYYVDAEIEKIVVTGASGLDVIGNGIANAVTGNAAFNLLLGVGGNDTLDGGGYFDELQGGIGNDLYILGDANNDGGTLKFDRVVEQPNEGIDTVEVSSTAGPTAYVLDANVERARIAGAAAFNLTGNSLDNLLTGNAAANALTGNPGNDTLTGAGGNDTLDGGAGTDKLAGGTGNDLYINPLGDTIVEGTDPGVDTVQSSATLSLGAFANVERLVLTGTANISGVGNALANLVNGNGGNNLLAGGGANDTLNGGAGNDTLEGGAGNDRLTGGTGADTYRFGAAAGADTVIGFDKAQDRFDLGGAHFTGRVEAGGDTTLTFAGGSVLVAGVTGLSLAQWNTLAPAPFVPEAFAAAAPSHEAEGLAFAAPQPAVAPLALTPFDYVFA